MSAQIIDGRAIAAQLRASVAEMAQGFLSAYDRKPRLDVILVGSDEASQVYVRSKERASAKVGIQGTVHRLGTQTSQGELLALVRSLNDDSTVDGILVQLPLPAHLDENEVLLAISPYKDVDGLHPYNAGLLALGQPGLLPCTPLGCMKLLEHSGLGIAGKQALVIGRSNLVGKPIAMLLLAQHATVTMAHSRTQNLPQLVREADIVVAAVGKANFVKGAWIKDGAAIIDVGINRLDNATLVGDVEYSAAKERAGYITPVPGGVGPMTIAMLLHNTIHAATMRQTVA